MRPLLKRPPSLYWAVVFILSAFFMALGLQLANVEEAQQQTRDALALAESSQALAERRQGQIEALQRLCVQLRETLAGEQERFERCLSYSGQVASEQEATE